jgi:hypothetical protein
MNKLAILAMLGLFAGCISTPWQSRIYSDHESIGRVLYEQIARLEKGTLRPIDLVPALQDTRVLFVDDYGISITVRDVAFGILDEAGIEGFPNGSAPVFICGCKAGNEWYRFHIPHLTDQEFDQTIYTIQQSGPAYVAQGAPSADP